MHQNCSTLNVLSSGV